MKEKLHRIRYKTKYGIVEEDLTKKEIEAVKLSEGIKDFRILDEVKGKWIKLI